MDFQLTLFRQNRENILQLLDSITLEQGNAIPENFRNNIIWNAGHTQIAQEFLLYYFSGLPMTVPKAYAPDFGSGSMAREYAKEEFDALKNNLQQTMEKVEQDFRSGKFAAQEYKGYTSEYFGPAMRTIDEAFQFNLYHEAVHFGSMLAIRRALQKEGGKIFR